MGVLAVLTFLAPFADRFNAGVATSFYNTASWDGESRITFTKHINGGGQRYGGSVRCPGPQPVERAAGPGTGPAGRHGRHGKSLRHRRPAGSRADALWDVAYYGGRYYVYFGLVPCLLFQLPFEALTGVRDLPPSLPMILLAWLMIWASFGCVKQALRRWFPRASAAAYLLATTGMAAGSQIWYLLLRPLVYEYAILSGAAFVLLGLWQVAAGRQYPDGKNAPDGSSIWCWAVSALPWWPGAAPRWKSSPCWRCPSSGSAMSPASGWPAVPGRGRPQPSCCR